jgi:hypothetical protein
VPACLPYVEDYPADGVMFETRPDGQEIKWELQPTETDPTPFVVRMIPWLTKECSKVQLLLLTHATTIDARPVPGRMTAKQ